MKNIYDLLKAVGVEVPTDKKAEFDKTVTENYKTVVDYDKQKEKLSKAEENLEAEKEEAKKLAETLKGSEDATKKIEELQKQVDDYSTAESARTEAEKKAQEDAQYNGIIDGIFEDDAYKDRKFINEPTKQFYYDKVKGELAKVENKGKGAKEIFESVTKDVEGIWINPQNPVHLPPTGKVTPDGIKSDTLKSALTNHYK
jgi:DNA repair exonuclease SbcCD ATPase subunit